MTIEKQREPASEWFACHETREAVTDPDGDAWYDHRGCEADDKCWYPAPFIGDGRLRLPVGVVLRGARLREDVAITNR